jgi:hypothetical protein
VFSIDYELIRTSPSETYRDTSVRDLEWQIKRRMSRGPSLYQPSQMLADDPKTAAFRLYSIRFGSGSSGFTVAAKNAARLGPLESFFLSVFVRKRMRSGDRPGLQNRRAAGNPVTDGFDSHTLPPVVF